MFYRRKLPHWHPDLSEQAFLFLTWRLAGSIPRHRLPEPSGPRSRGRAFLLMDRALDKATIGPVWLKDPKIARIVADAVRTGEREWRLYVLRSWVIMPNHVHLLLRPNQPLPVVTRWLKGSTARWANVALQRTGQPFWQDESFDHVVRNDGELDDLVRYIEENPVAAGLASRPQDWPWSSAGLAGGNACPT